MHTATNGGPSTFQINNHAEGNKKEVVQINFEYDILTLYPETRRGKRKRFQQNLNSFYQVVLQ